jgi:hypothetical protein
MDAKQVQESVQEVFDLTELDELQLATIAGGIGETSL